MREYRLFRQNRLRSDRKTEPDRSPDEACAFRIFPADRHPFFTISDFRILVKRGIGSRSLPQSQSLRTLTGSCSMTVSVRQAEGLSAKSVFAPLFRKTKSRRPPCKAELCTMQNGRQAPAPSAACRIPVMHEIRRPWQKSLLQAYAPSFRHPDGKNDTVRVFTDRDFWKSIPVSV